MTLTFDKKLDTLGLRCPEPIMLVRKAIRELGIGQVLYLIADDVATTRDVPSFCRYMDHELLSLQTESKPYQYWIKKTH